MVKIDKQLAPLTMTNGKGNKATEIAIHETGNNNKGTGAQSHANLQKNGNSREASWHYQVDEHGAIQSFEDNIIAWHAGYNGNRTSIAIEICVNSDGNFKKAVKNASELTTHLMKKHNIPLSRVKQHNAYTGKNCPQRLRSGSHGINWNQFKKMLGKGGAVSKAPVQSSGGKSIRTMADEVIAGKHGNGHAQRRKSLGVNGKTYGKVRALVNKGATTTKPKAPSKSVSTMAKEVIAGKHGNGHANRKKSLGVGDATYKQVRALVNKGGSSGGSKASKKYTKGANETSLVDFLKANKENYGYDARKKLAGQYGIKGYRGTAPQNTKLLGILKSK